MPIRPGEMRPGDVITAEFLNARQYPPAAGIRASGSISSRQNPDGSIQITGENTTCFVGIVGGSGITPRSGDTLGSGPVEVWIKNPSTGVYTDSGVSVKVDSVSSATGGVPSGCWVTCSYQPDGTATLVNVDFGT